MVAREKLSLSVEPSRLSKSKRKEIAGKRAENKREKAQKIWEIAENEPNKIRARKEKFIGSLEELLLDDNLLKSLKKMTPKEAKKRIEKIEGVFSNERDEKIGIKEKIIDLFKSDSKKDLYTYLLLISKAYPKDIEYLVSVDGAGKTNFVKYQQEAFRKI